MKDRARNFLFRFLKLAGLLTIVSTLPALAQFEVAPDHFDSTPAIEKKQGAKRSTVKTSSQNSGSRVSTSGQKSPATTPLAVAHNQNHGAGENTAHRKLAERKKASTPQSSAKRKKQTRDDNVAMATRH